MVRIILKSISNISLTSFVKVPLYGLLLLGIYYSALTNMIGRWGKAEYNYCYFIPFVVLYLLWDKKEKLTALPSVPSWKGMIPFGFGLLLFWLGELGGEYLTIYISLWLVVVGLCWIHLGWQKIKAAAFPLFMALTMFPLPDFLYTKISVKLQLLSSQLGVSWMRLYGMSVHREGNIIDLGFTQLQVVDACSGIRSLISLAVLGLLMAYFFRATFWKRALLVCSTVPLAIFANSVRLASTGILYQSWGREVAEGFFHGFSGFVIFGCAFAILLLEMWVLGKIPSTRLLISGDKQRDRKPGQAVEQVPVPDEESRPSVCQVLPSPSSEAALEPNAYKKLLAFVRSPRFMVATILLGATLVFSHGINFREKIPIIRSFDQFPLQAGEWIGTRQSMGRQFVKALDLSDYVIIDYHNPKNEFINLYVAYYESQKKGESIHSPATCLLGSGWIFREAGPISFSTPGYMNGSTRVNRVYMKKQDARQLCYYWFPQRGRVLTNAYQLKMYAFWDALTKKRTDGALVRLITPVFESEESGQADTRLQAFVRLIVPVLAEYIPGENIE
ncbi:MAG: exosortase C-terminal domain/associated protein EpsI [Pseudomonadota bacterium]